MSTQIFDRCMQLIYERARTGKLISVDHVSELIDEFYEIDGNICGGFLHVALDDFNLEDRSLLFCENDAFQNDDADGVALARVLLCMPENDRFVARLGEERAKEVLLEREGAS